MRNRPLAWAALAVGAGCALLFTLGAPPRMPIVNGAALLVGLLGVAAIRASRRVGASANSGDIALILASALVPLTVVVGPHTDGVARWLVVGGLTIQPAMIVVPLIALGLALRPTPLRSAAAVVAATGLAMQPDPGCAAMLLLGTVASLRGEHGRSSNAMIAAVAATMGLAVAVARNVALPPVPFVEGIYPDTLRAGLVPTFLAIAATMLMLAPGIVRPLRAPSLAFLGVWIAALVMALLPYPMPVLGFGGSGVLGFVLSAGLLGQAQAGCFPAKQG
jgi:hypothetical protein